MFVAQIKHVSVEESITFSEKHQRILTVNLFL